MRKAVLHRLGRVEYADGLHLQERFSAAVAEGLVPEQVLFLEHSAVLTLGRAAKEGNVLLSRDALRQSGIGLYETNRGGDVTYHGPGQLVGYPLLRLPADRQDVRRYVRELEEALIRTCADYGIAAARIPKWTGVWVGNPEEGTARKIAAIGVHLARWLTTHGFALNVNTDLSHFGFIVPCGIKEAGVTSIQQELGRAVPIDEVETKLAGHLAETLDLQFEPPAAPKQTVSVALTQSDKLWLFKRTEARGGFWQLVTGKVEAGESPRAAAARELGEETGHRLNVQPLDYQHRFAFGDALPPVVYEETAFVARLPVGLTPKLDPAEHTEAELLSPEEAEARLPFEGLKVAALRALKR